MHLTRGEISELFQRELGRCANGQSRRTHDDCAPRVAEKIFTADIGITGANFAIAETGMISITENEGNARLTAALPKTMISLIGIERMLPRLEDLALFLPMLATAGDRAGYDRLQHDVWRAAPARRKRRAGGISRRAARQSPHGIARRRRATRRAALHPLRRVPERLPDFPQRRRPHLRHDLQRPDRLGHHAASARLAGLETSFQRQSLCGACTETCPVKIDLHHHLLQNRRNAATQKPSLIEQIGFKAFAIRQTIRRLWALAKKMARIAQPLQKLVNGGVARSRKRLDANTRFAAGRRTESFKDWWKKETTQK